MSCKTDNFIKNAINLVEIPKIVKNQGLVRSNFPNLSNSLDITKMDAAESAITSWPNYSSTPLHKLGNIAEICNVKEIYYKDESKRFDLGSFKALGGAYAVASLVEAHKKKGRDPLDLTVTTATDGNHGRSVAWGASLGGCNSKIYIHGAVSETRESVMASFGAEVIRVEGNYEASLAKCKSDAEVNGWVIVSDTSWKDYRETPLQIMAGYSVMAREIIKEMKDERPTHAFLPVGVGGLAAGVVAPFWQDMGSNLFKAISVESHMSPCFQKSIEHQKPTLFNITEETLMAGLSCGEVSDIAWEILLPTLSYSLSINDSGVSAWMRIMADGLASGFSIEAGECSVAGLAALMAISKDKILKDQLEINEDSVILLIGTEGATDPLLYRDLLEQGNLR